MLTAGESHGKGLLAIVEGLPAGVSVEPSHIARELERRRHGYGRGGRQRFEADRFEIVSGVRHGLTLGSPVAIQIPNVEFDAKYSELMAVEGSPDPGKRLTRPRPGHADLAGAQKYGLADVRDALERASARHTAVAVAAGAVAKALLAAIGIEVAGAAVPEHGADPAAIDAAREDRDTLGGVVEVRAQGVPPGLGSYASRDTRLDARLAAPLMGIQAVKGVEIGDGFALAALRGSEAHDEIEPDRRRATNRAGGIEAGVSNGEEIVVRAAMKPLPTLMRPLRSVDLETGEPSEALVERSDVSAIGALAVVAEAAVAFELARAAREKFGGDALGDFVAAHRAYLERIGWRPTR